MAVIVVGGSGKDIGKTSLTCAIIAALRDFKWTAVKITGHDYSPPAAAAESQTIWEEITAGDDTDTARYLAAGARRALLVNRRGPDVPIEEIKRALGSDRNLIFESNRIVEVLRPDVCLALVNGSTVESKPSFRRLLAAADAVVNVGESDPNTQIPQFVFLPSLEMLTPELLQWLRKRLLLDSK